MNGVRGVRGEKTYTIVKAFRTVFGSQELFLRNMHSFFVLYSLYMSTLYSF